MIIFSLINPVPLGFVSTILSPLSIIYNPLRAASLYISCLFLYSRGDREMLHLSWPLFFLIPVYNILLLALDGHSNTKRISPGGAFTLTQPVESAKSFPKCASRAAFHCSRSPLYLRVWMSLVVSLCIYNQHDLSGSKLTFLDRVFAGYHFSFVNFSGFCVSVAVFCTGYLFLDSMVWVVAVGAMIVLGGGLVLPGVRVIVIVYATCLSRISSSDSLSSSMLIYSTGAISGWATSVGIGAADDSTSCLVGCGAAVAAICNYLTALAHLDRPSTSSTSFSLFLCLSTVFASSCRDGDRSAPFRLS
jgi:hypothetical protein